MKFYSIIFLSIFYLPFFLFSDEEPQSRANAPLLKDDVFFLLEDIWVEIHRCSSLKQVKRAKRLRQVLRSHEKLIEFFLEKLPTLDTEKEHQEFLQIFRPVQAKALPLYQGALEHKSGFVQKNILEILQSAEVDLIDQLENSLVVLLQHENFYPLALKLLQRNQSQVAVSVVFEKIQNPQSSIDVLVSSCLYLSAFSDERSITVLMNLFEDTRFAVRAAAVRALSKQGKKVEGKMLTLLESDNKLARFGAIHVLGNIQADPKNLQPLLLESDRTLKALAIRTLHRLGMPRQELKRIIGKTEDPWIRGALATLP